MNDDFELLTDLDPDMNYFSNYITENCQCTNFKLQKFIDEISLHCKYMRKYT